MSRFGDWLGTTATSFRIGRALLEASGLSAVRTHTLPDETGTVALTSQLTGGTVTSVAVADAVGITWTGSPITTSGTLTPTLSTNLQSWSGIAPATKANDVDVVKLTGAQEIAGAKTFRDRPNFAPATAINYVIDIGQTVGGASVITALDFHTGSVPANDFDVRLEFTGGNGTNGGGTLNIWAGGVFIKGSTVLTTLNTPVVTQAEAEAGTSTSSRIWTPQRVKQAINVLAPVSQAQLTAVQFPPTELVSGTAYTVVAADAGKVKKLTNAGAVAITLSNGVLATDQIVYFQNAATGAVTFANGGTMVITPTAGDQKQMAAAPSFAAIRADSATAATLFGGLEPTP